MTRRNCQYGRDRAKDRVGTPLPPLPGPARSRREMRPAGEHRAVGSVPSAKTLSARHHAAQRRATGLRAGAAVIQVKSQAQGTHLSRIRLAAKGSLGKSGELTRQHPPRLSGEVVEAESIRRPRSQLNESR